LNRQLTRSAINTTYVLTVKKQGDVRSLATQITDDLSGQNVLLVEDILETGKSLQTALKYLKSKGANVRTAAIYVLPDSEVKPDFYLSEETGAIIFPWD